MQSLEQKNRLEQLSMTRLIFFTVNIFTFSHLLQYRDKVDIVIVKKRSKFLSLTIQLIQNAVTLHDNKVLSADYS